MEDYWVVRGRRVILLMPLAVQAVPIAANYMPSVLFFNVVSVPQIGTAGFEPTSFRLNGSSGHLRYAPKAPGDLSRSGASIF